MSLYKRGEVYWYKFQFAGQSFRESTKQGNDKIARKMEAVHRTRLAEGLVGIREKKVFPTLTQFLTKDFLPYVETKHQAKPGTVRVYKEASKNLLLSSDLAPLRLDEINDKHVQQFVGRRSHLSAARINTGLRVLKIALNLAADWDQLERVPKLSLAKGERRRERVLTNAELAAYLDACPQPWKDCATMIADEGMRPGEVFALDWPHILLYGEGGLIGIRDGKSSAARRTLPMTPRVFELLRARHEAAGCPVTGWVFPKGSKGGHFDSSSARYQHAAALAQSGVKRFEPYTLRHTALTTLAMAGADAFTLQKIAGHSSILMTQRYIHPQADAMERLFAAAHPPAALPASGVGTKLGTVINEAHESQPNMRGFSAEQQTISL